MFGVVAVDVVVAVLAAGVIAVLLVVVFAVLAAGVVAVVVVAVLAAGGLAERG